MAVGIWKYLICNRYDGDGVAELTNVYDRQVTLPLDRLPTASGRLRLDHPLIDRVSDDDLLLKAYRNNALKFLGPILTAEESADASAQTIQFNAVGGFYYIQNRLLGKPAQAGSGDTTGWAYGTAGDLKQRSEIANQIMLAINSDGYTGIDMGAKPTMPADSHYGPVTFSPAGEAIIELSSAFGGYDWEVTPVEPVTPGAGIAVGGVVPKKIGDLNLYYPRKGRVIDNAVFEYGIGGRAAVVSYKRTISKDSLLTKGYVIPPGWPTSGTVGENPLSNTGSLVSNTILRNRGLIEGVVPTDQTSADLRQSLVDAHVNIRKDPRYLLTFSLRANATPSPFDVYNTGDFIRARAVYNGVVRFDAFFRVWGITANIDNAGNEQIELELMEPSS